jgi:monoterpene epsilon-lactone hydrolase
MIHAWPLWSKHLTAGREAIASAGSFIRKHTGGESAAG